MKTLIIVTLLFTLNLSAFAQEPGKDHPILSRMPHFHIDSYETNFDRVEIPIGDEDVKPVEGTKTQIYYAYNGEEDQNPSPLQLLRNHDNAVKKLGGKVLFNDNLRTAGYQITKNNQNIWVKLEVTNGGEMYLLTVLEEESMKQEVTANELFNALDKDGFVALYINFDNGKSTIRTESQEIIEQIAEMLKQNEDLKISVEGHTDNVGTAEANKALSLSRSKAVVNALVAKGIDAKRLQSKGWGQENPVADNRIEEGRSKNRRVELIKL